jgi:hypothetical protein
MREEQLRELATMLRQELPDVIDDAEERAKIRAQIETALALPEGEAKQALVAVLRARPETRTWVAARTGADESDVDRGIPGVLGSTTTPLGVHVVCPNGDYDRYLESATEDLGRCPHDGRKLVRAAD